MYTMTVAPGADVSGGFYSLKAAFAAMPEDPTVPVTIRVMPGIYHEKLSLTRPNVTIEGAGASPSDTVISFGDYGYEIMPRFQNSPPSPLIKSISYGIAASISSVPSVLPSLTIT